jgi:hypothetical protein
MLPNWKLSRSKQHPGGKTMRLVEQHIIKKGDPRYEKIDQTAFASKNLWNVANYVVRQSFDPKRTEKPRFSGRREGRWYWASGKRLIHADVNGSYNIARKVFSTAFDGPEIEAPAVRPIRLAVK